MSAEPARELWRRNIAPFTQWQAGEVCTLCCVGSCKAAAAVFLLQGEVMCLSGLAFPSGPHCVLLVHLPPVQPTTPSLLLSPLHNCPALWLCFFFDPHTKQHSPSGFVLIPCSRKTHLNLFIDKTAIVFRSVGHLWACARQKPRRAMQCLALSWPRKGATVFRIPVSQCWSVGILVARLLRFKDAKPCCRGAACNQCADLLVEGPAFARATSALLGHTWAAKFWRNRKYPG